MYANILAGKIVMSQNESKKAGRVGTDEFNELMSLRKAFPDSIITVEKKRSTNRGIALSIDFMLKCIEKHDGEEAAKNKKTLFEYLGRDENGHLVDGKKVHSIGEIKMWFLDAHPDIEKENKKNDDDLAVIKEGRKKAREADARAERDKRFAA